MIILRKKPGKSKLLKNKIKNIIVESRSDILKNRENAEINLKIEINAIKKQKNNDNSKKMVKVNIKENHCVSLKISFSGI